VSGRPLQRENAERDTELSRSAAAEKDALDEPAPDGGGGTDAGPGRRAPEGPEGPGPGQGRSWGPPLPVGVLRSRSEAFGARGGPPKVGREREFLPPSRVVRSSEGGQGARPTPRGVVSHLLTRPVVGAVPVGFGLAVTGGRERVYVRQTGGDFSAFGVEWGWWGWGWRGERGGENSTESRHFRTSREHPSRRREPQKTTGVGGCGPQPARSSVLGRQEGTRGAGGTIALPRPTMAGDDDERGAIAAARHDRSSPFLHHLSLFSKT
jgi:hypothetical protein